MSLEGWATFQSPVRIGFSRALNQWRSAPFEWQMSIAQFRFSWKSEIFIPLTMVPAYLLRPKLSKPQRD
jgi:hypothetical protein